MNLGSWEDSSGEGGGWMETYDVGADLPAGDLVVDDHYEFGMGYSFGECERLKGIEK